MPVVQLAYSVVIIIGEQVLCTKQPPNYIYPISPWIRELKLVSGLAGQFVWSQLAASTINYIMPGPLKFQDVALLVTTQTSATCYPLYCSCHWHFLYICIALLGYTLNFCALHFLLWNQMTNRVIWLLGIAGYQLGQPAEFQVERTLDHVSLVALAGWPGLMQMVVTEYHVEKWKCMRPLNSQCGWAQLLLQFSIYQIKSGGTLRCKIPMTS